MTRFSLSILLITLLFSCQKKTETKDQNIALHNQHWSYNGETGPVHWNEIELKSECGGKFQSPINIVNYRLNSEAKALDLQYAENTKIHDVTNNGHTIQYNFEEGDFLNLGGLRYDLKQFHFHEPAEHTIDGIRYPLEIHLVHLDDSGQYVVVSIMAKEGKSSAPFDFLESFLPLKINETKTVNSTFNINNSLPAKKGYFSYTGSLTTPPCSEGVKWFILKNPITVSVEQVELLKNLMPLNNYRNQQPLHGRQLFESAD